MISKRLLVRFGAVCALATTLSAALPGHFPGGVHAAQAASGLLVKPHYGALPLSFIANAGQVDPSIRFQVRNSGGTLSFESSGVLLALTPQPSHPLGEGESLVHPSPAGEGPGVRASGASVAIHLSFENANPNLALSGTAQLPGIANFFIGNDPSQWHTNVPTYAGVVYHNLYPGVDLRYAGHSGLLKGTYTLAASVDPTLIRWRYVGATGVNLDPATGNLIIQGQDGVTLTEQAPVAWQTRGSVQTPIMVGYEVNADGSVQFAPNIYDGALPLTIDPGLVYSTYLGGSGLDKGQGIAVDSSGNAYITGYTASIDFPTTPGAFQTSNNGSENAFVIKLNATGSALIYSTYLGGSGTDVGSGIAVDSGGNAYVTGSTSSTNFPTTPGAFQLTSVGSGDAFVSELSATGSALAYSTYLGGSDTDAGGGIAVDGSGNAYVTGTASANFPTTPGAYQTTGGGAFMSKLNPSASGAASMVYSTFLGGAYEGDGIAVDSSGNVYVSGDTLCLFQTTPGAYQTTCSNGSFRGHAFMSKLNPSLSGTASLIYATYLGGSGYEEQHGIAVDGSGNAYVTGYTESTNFPITNGAYQTTFGGGLGVGDAYVSKLNPSLSGTASLVYSTYLGGNLNDGGGGIAVDGSGNAYVIGSTSGNFPTTAGAYQTAYNGGSFEIFMTKLNAAGNALVYSTYLGGSGYEQAHGVAVDETGNAYVAGFTDGSFPTTAGAYQTTYNGGSDAFVSKLDFIPLPTSTPTTTPTITDTPTVTDTPTTTLTATSTNTFTNTPTATSTSTQTNTRTNTPTATLTSTSTNTPSQTPTITPTATPTNTPIPPRIDSIGVFRNGTFLLRLHNSTGFADISVAFNSASKPYPVVGDWTGAGYDTVGVFDQTNGLFTLCNANVTAMCTSGANQITFVLGAANDIPLGGKWNAGFTHFGAGVFRPSNGLIYFKNNLTSGFADYTMVLGIPGDVGLAGDWNADGLDSPGVYRASNQHFYLADQVCNCSPTANYALQYGIAGDAPVVGDWIGQGRDGIGLFRQSNGFTYLRNSLTTGFADLTFTYGIAGDVPVAGHYQVVYPPKATPGNVVVPMTAVPTPNSSLGD